MNTSRRAPLWIRVPSYFFAFMGVVSIATVFIISLYPDAKENISISFVSNSVKYTDSPAAFLGIDFLFIFAGVLAFLILFRSKRAYDIGILYSVSALLLLGTITALGIGVVNDKLTTYLGLFLVFGGLGLYFWRNREQWIKS